MRTSSQGPPLADLLHQIARDVVSTQRQLDESFLSARATRAESGKCPCPVWCVLESVGIALEFDASVHGGPTIGGRQSLPELICQLPDPVSAALYGHEAVRRTRISLKIAPIVPNFEL